MSKPSIASVHRYSNRFLRSTDLVRDFRDPHGLDGYALTPFTRDCVRRIADGFRQESSRRAWRLTGDFGTGKSSFALLLANVLRQEHGFLPKPIRDEIATLLPTRRQNFVPVLVAGSREPIAAAVLRAVQATLADLYTRGAKSSLEKSIEQALKSESILSSRAVELIEEANAKIIQTDKGAGLFLVLDEVGKFLEYAAISPGDQDVFFLQQLAEKAARSGKEPFFVVCILHQGFNAYAEGLAPATQREWEKIAGRFDEIIFKQPLDQVVSLVGSAIDADSTRVPKDIQQAALANMEAAIQLGWYGTSSSRDILRSVHARLFPLDAMVIPVLVRFFQNFGQNERSLFSFLCSYEPFGLRAFAQRELSSPAVSYQLADFYDYVRANFGYKLTTVGFRTHWNVIESTIEAHNEVDLLESRILKTVGVLNLLGADDLRPTKDAVALALGHNSERIPPAIDAALTRLARQNALHFRGETRGYSLWPYTSVDIDARLAEAKRAIPQVFKISTAIAGQLDSQPVVARAHYIRTGNLRYFDIVYCRPEEMSIKAAEYQTRADGFILVPFCETEAETKHCKAAARELKERSDLVQIVAVPRPLSHLSLAALDAMRWEWVQKETPELNNDRFAREEVQLHLQEARDRLRSQVQQFLGLAQVSGKSTLTWFFHEDGELQSRQFESGRGAIHQLSLLCDRAYSKAPLIKNELLNRHNLSAAAAAARMRLIELMFAQADKEDLGFPADRWPPEKSMYLSVLRTPGMHRQEGKRWVIGEPVGEDVAHVRPILKKIKAILAKSPDTRLAITDILKELRRPPFGIRDGLFPVLLTVIAVRDEQEIAFYERGSFLSEIGSDAFRRMSRAPEDFEIQYCKIEGVRSELFERLVQLLDLPQSEDKSVELLDVVRNLCQFVAQLPEYVRNTRKLSPTAQAVREVILAAREPARMVFHDLPDACGFAKFEIGKASSSQASHKFVAVLKTALDELRAAYFNLHRRMGEGIAREFGYDGQAPNQFRRQVSTRAEHLLVRITEMKLKAFAFRLVQASGSESEWLESIGSVLALRPPAKWRDEDEDTFNRELEAYGGRFRRAESVGFTGTASKPATGMRIAVTRSDGTEREEVVHIVPAEEPELKALQEQILKVIGKNQRLGLAAASRAIWGKLKPSPEQ